LITFAFCEKEGNVGVTGLEILGVSTGFDDVASDDDLPEAQIFPMVVQLQNLIYLWVLRLKRLISRENSSY
jgi:hypothetical protein